MFVFMFVDETRIELITFEIFVKDDEIKILFFT